MSTKTKDKKKKQSVEKNNPFDWFKLAEAVIDYRFANDMTADAFIKKAGVSRMAVYRCEIGSIMDLDTTRKICNAIDKTVQSFM